MPRRTLVVSALILGFPLASFILPHTCLVPSICLAVTDTLMAAGVLIGLCLRGSLRFRVAAGFLSATLGLVALNAAVLALTAPVETVLLFANSLINYVFIGLFFAAEYLYTLGPLSGLRPSPPLGQLL